MGSDSQEDGVVCFALGLPVLVGDLSWNHILLLVVVFHHPLGDPLQPFEGLVASLFFAEIFNQRLVFSPSGDHGEGELLSNHIKIKMPIMEGDGDAFPREQNGEHLGVILAMKFL